jgi:hypothetical protein
MTDRYRPPMTPAAEALARGCARYGVALILTVIVLAIAAVALAVR